MCWQMTNQILSSGYRLRTVMPPALTIFGSGKIVNLSLCDLVDALHNYVYRSAKLKSCAARTSGFRKWTKPIWCFGGCLPVTLRQSRMRRKSWTFCESSVQARRPSNSKRHSRLLLNRSVCQLILGVVSVRTPNNSIKFLPAFGLHLLSALGPDQPQGKHSDIPCSR